MKKWFIPNSLVIANEVLSKRSYLGKHKVTTKEIVLYNKNANCNYVFWNPIKATNRIVVRGILKKLSKRKIV